MSVALHGSNSGKTHQIAAMLSLASCIPSSQQCLVHPLSLNVLGSSSGYRSIAVDVVHSAGPGKRAAKANTSIKRGMLAMHCMPLHAMYLKVQTLAHAVFHLRLGDSAMHASKLIVEPMLQTHLMVLFHCCLMDWIADTLSQGCIVVSVVLLLFHGLQKESQSSFQKPRQQ